MSSVIMTVAVEDLAVEPLGVKEAAMTLLEPLGGVRVLSIREWSEEVSLVGFNVDTHQNKERKIESCQ